MDGRRFDHLARALSEAGTRRGLLGLLATLPVLGGLFALLAPEDLGAKGRRKRRKKRHKHGKGKGRRKNKNKNKHKKQKCKAKSRVKICNGKCGSVKNNCKKTVDCGSCDCAPPCDECFTCQGKAGQPGACVPRDAGTSCGDPATCADGTRTPRGSCDGSGACQPGAPVSCAPYTRCDGNACAATCADEDDCVAGSFCDADHQCAGDGADGEPCTHGGQCQSGFCVDDVCCDTACDGACEACNLSGNVGACTVEADGTGCGGGDICCSGACQECCDSGDCSGAQPLCCAGTCEACCDSADCAGNTPICDAGACVACNADPEGCPGDTCCDADSGECVGACPAADPVCGADNVCVPCSDANPCPTGQCCAADGTCGACLVFVTSTVSDGNLGGLEGAHLRCQTLAGAASLPGTYLAWLSDEGAAAPIDFFTRATVPYTLTNGTPIANNWDDLTDGTLAAPIDRDENGDAVAESFVWTNTNANGTVFGVDDCQSWTGTINDTMIGATNRTSNWSIITQVPCTSWNRRLFCFQQS